MYAEVGNLNPYALDYPVCLEDSPRKAGRAQRTWFLNHQLAAMREEYSGVHEQGLASIRKSIVGLEPVDGYEPCASDYMSTYLNLPEVKAALHVKSDIKWLDCSRTIRYSQVDGAKSMTPYYKYLIDKKFGLNILVYSGDDDDVCATIGTQSWIWDLGYHVSGRRWQEWLTADGQTAGYLTKFRNTKLAFATVHGAGTSPSRCSPPSPPSLTFRRRRLSQVTRCPRTSRRQRLSSSPTTSRASGPTRNRALARASVRRATGHAAPQTLSALRSALASSPRPPRAAHLCLCPGGCTCAAAGVAPVLVFVVNSAHSIRDFAIKLPSVPAERW